MEMSKCSTCINRLLDDKFPRVCIECINSRVPFSEKQDNYVQQKNSQENN